MKKLLKNLTFQVVVAIILGIIVGLIWPNIAQHLQVLGNTFINAVKMVIAPIIFLTLVLGIAKMGDMKKVGKVGGKAIIYFEVVTTIALIIGLIVVNIVNPGKGIDPNKIPKGDASQFTSGGGDKINWVDFFAHIVPSNVFDAFAKGDILQILFFAILFGIGLSALGKKGQPVIDLFDKLLDVFFKIISYIMKAAPIGAFGAMSFTIGKFGLETIGPLAKVMVCMYVTMILFVFIVLGIICKLYGFSLWTYLRYIKDEILIVLGTSSSESVLPRMMDKMERFGCPQSVVGLTIPMGYSFNLDGTCIYLTMATVFLAQVFHVPLSLEQQLLIILILMLTSKGAAAVTGGGFIVLASTLTAMHVIPIAGLGLLLGIDRFMSEARAIVNLIGNGIASIVVSKSEKDFDDTKRQNVELALKSGKKAS
ncbi:C4-dicarboxylate transporter DctA [Scopulibacillus cellulosilyticus]|uniref:C4-dicarboxylate transporter DctA n=1 Tax=Scopulibacillus cellulosilyticus TaxID=2665665 RepID=A0ABW2PXH3_9BACL